MIYLDNAATTKMDPIIAKEMIPYLEEAFGNPSSIYEIGKKTKAAVQRSREQIAQALDSKPEEIYFTSGGSEADNWVLKGVYDLLQEKGNHIITSKIEHPAILNTCKYLEQYRKAKITYLEVDKQGSVAPEMVEAAITDQTILISVMFANNEVGTMQKIKEIGEIAHHHGILFHTDAVQAFAHVPISVRELSIDYLSASGHKFNGPKGIGFLYMNTACDLVPLIQGGSQEQRRRAGTENISGIVGIGRAAQIGAERLEERMRKETALRDRLMFKLLEEVPDTYLNGDPIRRLPNNIHVGFGGVDAEMLLRLLNRRGIYASGGSACSAGDLEPSHVLLAMGKSRKRAQESIRFTISHETTEDEIDLAAKEIKMAVETCRNMKLY